MSDPKAAFLTTLQSFHHDWTTRPVPQVDVSPKTAIRNGTQLLKNLKNLDAQEGQTALPTYVRQFLNAGEGAALDRQSPQTKPRPEIPGSKTSTSLVTTDKQAELQGPTKSSESTMVGLLMGLSAGSSLCDGALLGAVIGLVVGSAWVLFHRDPQKTYGQQLGHFVGRSAGMGALMLGALRFLLIDFPLLAIAIGLWRFTSCLFSLGQVSVNQTLKATQKTAASLGELLLPKTASAEKKTPS